MSLVEEIDKACSIQAFSFRNDFLRGHAMSLDLKNVAISERQHFCIDDPEPLCSALRGGVRLHVRERLHVERSTIMIGNWSSTVTETCDVFVLFLPSIRRLS